MPDFGILTLPLLGAVGVFVFSMLTGNDLTIDRIRVMSGIDTESHNEVVLTRQLIDEMRGINESAEADLVGVDVGGSAIDRSLTDFEEYFNLSAVVAGVRDIAGITPYHVVSEMTPEAEGVRLTCRIYAPGDQGQVSLVTVTGKVSDLKPMFHEAAVQILTDISPYIVALHFFNVEMAQEDLSFQKTRELLGRHIGKSPRWRTYLAYDLIGRTHRVRAELGAKLSPEDREKELELATEYLQAALIQNPNFFYSNLNLAMVYTDRHQFDLADQYFAKTVVINRNDATTRMKWAETLAAQGRTREAIRQYVAAVELAPHNADLRDKLAELYVKEKHFDAAKQQWRAAFQIDPMHKAFAERLRWVDSALK